MPRKILISLAILLVLGLLAYIFRDPLRAALTFFADLEKITRLARETGAWGWLILAALLVLQVFLAFIPGQALMASTGYLYGFWGGTLLTWASLSLGGQLAFWLARQYGRPFVLRFVAPDLLAKWHQLSLRQGIAFYSISLVLPIFPNDAMCYVAGLAEISPRRFLIANLTGRLAASAAMAYVGAYGAQFSPGLWGLIAVVIVGIMLTWYLVQAKLFPQPIESKSPEA